MVLRKIRREKVGALKWPIGNYQRYQRLILEINGRNIYASYMPWMRRKSIFFTTLYDIVCEKNSAETTLVKRHDCFYHFGKWFKTLRLNKYERQILKTASFFTVFRLPLYAKQAAS